MGRKGDGRRRLVGETGNRVKPGYTHVARLTTTQFVLRVYSELIGDGWTKTAHVSVRLAARHRHVKRVIVPHFGVRLVLDDVLGDGAVAILAGRPADVDVTTSFLDHVKIPGEIRRLLYIQVDRHFVAAVSVRGYAEVSRAVLSARAYKLERADYAVGRVLLLKRVPIVGKFLLQVCAHLLPKYLQGMITLRLATEGSARA